jgi:DNA invertase Pin-like site-specific DNA recombinase
MQQLAMNGGFDVLVAESLDRLSRDQEHIAGLHKRMAYRGIQIFTKAEGAISEMHIGLGGTMSALFLRQLAQKTHRGLEGRVKAGKSAGGISYGYALDRQPLPDGTYTTGDRVIDPAEAAIVQRIFTEYDRGRSARAIAIGLNRDSIPAPRSGGRAKLGRSRDFRQPARDGHPTTNSKGKRSGTGSARQGSRQQQAAGAP